MPRIDGGWIASTHDTGGNTVDTETLISKLEFAAATYPERIFVDFAGAAYTYRRVRMESAQLASGLAALGIGPGDTVASLLDNGPDAVLLMFAVSRLGAIYVPINTAFKAEYLRHQVADSGAKVMVAESDYAQRVLAIAEGAPELKSLLYRGAFPGEGRDRLRVEPLDRYRLDVDAPTTAASPSDLAMIIYSGGTTGPSKGCAVSHAYVLRMARHTNEIAGRQADEVNWNPMPLFHLNAVSSIVCSLLLGSTTVLERKFSVSQFWPEIERADARVVNLLGTMIPLIAAMPDTDAMARCKGQIRAVLGSPFTPETERIWRDRFGVELVGNPFYGLSECAPMTAAPLADKRPPGSCGRVVADLDVRIFNDDDHELPAGEVGEIVCRPLRPNAMFQGYWRRPEATTAATRNLWFHTGDLGRFDEDGWLYFVDRKKDYLRRGGENISSMEMETTLIQHPDVAEAAVHAVFSELSEDEVKATVVLRPDATVTEEELCRWTIERVPYFAVPRYIEFRDSLPKNQVGRVQKYELREAGCTPTTWDRLQAGVTFERR